MQNPPSPYIYNKLVQCCKQFFVKNPILIISVLNYHKEENDDEGVWEFSYGGEIVNLEALGSKMWFINDISVVGENPVVLDSKLISSFVIPKTYRSDAREVSISDQIMSFNEFKLLVSSVKESMYLRRVTVKHEDGSTVQVEKIIESCTNVKRINYECDSNYASITSKTFKELVNIQHFHDLSVLCLKNVPETFDIDAFILYIK
uniref:Uncharacterized protein n=1 Tax=Panagrolaimus sp. PS1159 TaxID=55785 RepID=A0AC35GFY6_9BILA